MDPEELCYHVVDYGIEMNSIEISDLKELFCLESIDEFEYLMEKTKKNCLNIGFGNAFNVSLKKSKDSIPLISIIGVYLIIISCKNLKKYKILSNYEDYFREGALNDLLRYYGFSLKNVII